MKRILLVFFLLMITLSAQAQSEGMATFEFGTGTTIDYPVDWESEIQDGILTLTETNESTVLVIDYPLISSLSEEQARIPAREIILIIGEILLELEIDPRDLYEFKLGVRNIVAYDLQENISASIFVVEFSNGATGVLFSVGLEDDLENEMLQSFDNSEAVIENLAQSTIRNPAERDVPTVLVFGKDRRVVIPPGFEVAVRQEDDFQVMTLTLPDDALQVQLFDMSEAIPNNTELENLLEISAVDWETDFGFEIGSTASDYYFGEREAISYPLTIDASEGLLVVLRFSDDAIGLVAITGSNLDEHETDINQIIGSFNVFGVAIRLIQ